MLSFLLPVCFSVWVPPFLSSHFNLPPTHTQFRPSFMSYDPFCAGVERGEKKCIWVLILSFCLAFCATVTAEKKKKDRKELERSLTALFHSRGMKRRDDYEGWWVVYFIHSGILTPLQKFTKNTLFHLYIRWYQKGKWTSVFSVPIATFLTLLTITHETL